MAHCVISVVENGPVDEAACVVHTAFVPCPFDGSPANPAPLHGDTVNDRDRLVQAWEARTDRQRPLHIHRGDQTDGTHNRGADDMCPCGPEIVPAEQRQEAAADDD